MDKNERSCFHCKEFMLCCLRHDIEDVTRKHIHMIAVDISEKTEATWVSIFTAVAKTCIHYEFKEDK